MGSSSSKPASSTAPTSSASQYTYQAPAMFINVGVPEIQSIDVTQNNGKVINPKIFARGSSTLTQAQIDAVDAKIQEQYDKTPRYATGNVVNVNNGGGKRRKQSRKIKRRKTRKNNKK